MSRQKIISLLLPTRGRKEQCTRFLNSVAQMAEDPGNLEVIICVDTDDIESHKIRNDLLKTKMIVRDQQTMGKYNSDCLEAASGDIVFLVNDDIEVRTKGWDQKILAMDSNYPDGVYLAYPNDMFKGARQPTFPILSKTLCDLLGDPFPSSYRGSFIEYHILDIFMRLKKLNIDRIHFMQNTVFEHRHYRLGKSEIDETYKNRDRFGDDLNFILENGNRRNQAKKLVNHIRQKKVFPRVEPLVKPKEYQHYGRVLISYLIQLLSGRDNVPISWRLFLALWFSARFLAMCFSRVRQKFTTIS